MKICSDVCDIFVEYVSSHLQSQGHYIENRQR